MNQRRLRSQTWLHWDVEVGGVMHADLNRMRARKLVEDGRRAGLECRAWLEGTEVSIFTSTFHGELLAALIGPDGKAWPV